MVEERHTDAKEWLSYAEDDLGVAKHLLETYYPKPLAIICFHCQQAAEKAVKSIIVQHGSQGGDAVRPVRHVAPCGDVVRRRVDARRLGRRHDRGHGEEVHTVRRRARECRR